MVPAPLVVTTRTSSHRQMIQADPGQTTELRFRLAQGEEPVKLVIDPEKMRLLR